MSNVNKLPDSYAKSTDSNNYKLLNLNEQAIADVKADAQALYDSLDLKQATGHTLDLYGEMVGQKRGVLTDEQYYYMILTKLGINAVQGNYATISAMMQKIFDCKASDIILRDGATSGLVEVEKFPLSVLVDAGFTSKNAIELIESLLPIGVIINDASFEGTFEFADTADEYDEAAGFADLNQTIGGYFGLLLGDDENSPVLPF